MFRKSRPKGLLCASVASSVYDVRFNQDVVSGVIVSQRQAVANSSVSLPRPSEYKLQDLLKAGVPLQELPTSGIIDSGLSQDDAVSQIQKVLSKASKKSPRQELEEKLDPSIENDNVES